MLGKLEIGLDHAPAAFDLRSRLLGRNGCNLEYIRKETGVVVILEGGVSGKGEPLQFRFAHHNAKTLRDAGDLVRNLLDHVKQDLNDFFRDNSPPLLRPPPSSKDNPKVPKKANPSSPVPLQVSAPVPPLADPLAVTPQPSILFEPRMVQLVSNSALYIAQDGTRYIPVNVSPGAAPITQIITSSSILPQPLIIQANIAPNLGYNVEQSSVSLQTSTVSLGGDRAQICTSVAHCGDYQQAAITYTAASQASYIHQVADPKQSVMPWTLPQLNENQNGIANCKEMQCEESSRLLETPWRGGTHTDESDDLEPESAALSSVECGRRRRRVRCQQKFIRHYKYYKKFEAMNVEEVPVEMQSGQKPLEECPWNIPWAERTADQQFNTYKVTKESNYSELKFSNQIENIHPWSSGSRRPVPWLRSSHC